MGHGGEFWEDVVEGGGGGELEEEFPHVWGDGLSWESACEKAAVSPSEADDHVPEAAGAEAVSQSAGGESGEDEGQREKGHVEPCEEDVVASAEAVEAGEAAAG